MKQKEAQRKPLPKGDPSLSQSAQTTGKETQPETAPVTPAPVPPAETAPVASVPAPAAEKKEEKKETKPSISTVTRSLVIDHPEKSVDDLIPLLVQAGFPDAANRKSTIATLRTDALAILKIAKEKGWKKE
jgi:hypothetical protein